MRLVFSNTGEIIIQENIIENFLYNNNDDILLKNIIFGYFKIQTIYYLAIRILMLIRLIFDYFLK